MKTRKNGNSSHLQIGKTACLIIAFLGLLFVFPGCFAAAAGVIVYIVDKMETNVKVDLQAPPEKVFAAVLKVLERKPQVKFDNCDEKHMHMDCSQGKNKLAIHVKPVINSDMTRLSVTASSNETDMTHGEFALKFAEEVCDELGLKYTVVEKKK